MDSKQGVGSDAVDLPKFLIYAVDPRSAAKLAASLDLHLSQWKWMELYTNRPFAVEAKEDE